MINLYPIRIHTYFKMPYMVKLIYSQFYEVSMSFIGFHFKNIEQTIEPIEIFKQLPLLIKDTN